MTDNPLPDDLAAKVRVEVDRIHKAYTFDPHHSDPPGLTLRSLTDLVAPLVKERDDLRAGQQNDDRDYREQVATIERLEAENKRLREQVNDQE